MRVLIVTEKCGAPEEQRDGGARLVESLERGFGERAEIMQFVTGNEQSDGRAKWCFRYPKFVADRFVRRIANAEFIAERVREVASHYTDIIFVHVSMQFGCDETTLKNARAWTFPMFLTPSYVAAGEHVPAAYTELERRVLATTQRILSPSHLERAQITSEYGVAANKVRVVPRGVNRKHFFPKHRRIDDSPLFCSVGSIKRQKNTIALIRLFHALREKHPRARLRLIGPAQDREYASAVEDTIATLGLQQAIECVGYVPHEDLGKALEDAHIHLSASACETFGRAIFETLASGLPNVAPGHRNAAADYLQHAPYAYFYRDQADALHAIETVLANYESLSSTAIEVGELFDDEILCQRLVAELQGADVLAVADFDGTLFHKENAERTRRSVDAFHQYPKRVVCSARPIEDLLAAMRTIGADADFALGWSGAVARDRSGNTMWRSGFSTEGARVAESRLPANAQRIVDADTILQYCIREQSSPVVVPGARVETYQGISFVGPWEISKFRGIHRLLKHIGWSGRIRAFGDSHYDEEFLRYLDGTLVRSDERASTGLRQAKEVIHELD